MTYTKESSIETIIGVAATKIADAINADAIIAAERATSDLYNNESPYYEIKVSVFKKIKLSQYAKAEYKTKIKKPELGSIVPIKDLLMDAIAHRFITKGNRIVFIQNESMGSGYKGMLFIFDVDTLFFEISTNRLAENINSDVIETIISIALELSTEGREGKKVGTAFIIGDKEIMNYTKQLIINPFTNIEEKDRNVTDPKLRETIKNFAQLDGVFIINKEGIILSAGTYLNIDVNTNLEFPQGLGTKHRNCAAITSITDALAIVISDSGGKIKVFKKGKMIMQV